MNDTIYIQCKLERRGEHCTYEQAAYIPAHLAIVNQTLKLKKPNGSWQEGWRVVACYGACSKTLISSLHGAHKAFESVLDPHR